MLKLALISCGVICSTAAVALNLRMKNHPNFPYKSQMKHISEKNLCNLFVHQKITHMNYLLRLLHLWIPITLLKYDVILNNNSNPPSYHVHSSKFGSLFFMSSHHRPDTSHSLQQPPPPPPTSTHSFILFPFFDAERDEYMNDNSEWVTAEICRRMHCPGLVYRRWQWVWLRDRQLAQINPNRASSVNTMSAGFHSGCSFVIKAGGNEWFLCLCQHLVHWRACQSI